MRTRSAEDSVADAVGVGWLGFAELLGVIGVTDGAAVKDEPGGALVQVG